jgi:hypothetical protein
MRLDDPCSLATSLESWAAEHGGEGADYRIGLGDQRAYDGCIYVGIVSRLFARTTSEWWRCLGLSSARELVRGTCEICHCPLVEVGVVLSLVKRRWAAATFRGTSLSDGSTGRS